MNAAPRIAGIQELQSITGFARRTDPVAGFRLASRIRFSQVCQWSVWHCVWGQSNSHKPFSTGTSWTTLRVIRCHKEGRSFACPVMPGVPVLPVILKTPSGTVSIWAKLTSDRDRDHNPLWHPLGQLGGFRGSYGAGSLHWRGYSRLGTRGRGYPLPLWSMKTMELERREHQNLWIIRVYRQNLEKERLRIASMH